MFGKYVGLDIGAKTINITLIKRGFRDITLLGTWSFNTPVDRGSVPAVLNEYLKGLGLPTSELAVGVLANPISIRALKFPFWNPKKIEMVYRFELENVSSFNPEEKVHSYNLVKGPEDSGEAIVCMYNSEDIKEILSITEEAGLNPRMLTFPPVAYAMLEEYIGENRPAVLLNLGATKTSFALFDTSGLRRVRISPIGGEHITGSLAENLNLDLSEAEEIKHRGLLGENPGAVVQALKPFMDEIRKTIRFFNTEINSGVVELVLTGGTSLMPGLGEFIARELEIDVSDLLIPPLGSSAALFSESFALSLYGSSSSGRSLNLRKDEFRFRGRHEEIKGAFLTPSVLLAIILIIFLYTSCQRYFELKSGVKQMEVEITQVVKKTFPDIAVIPKPEEFIQAEVSKIKKNIEFLENLKVGATPLDALRAISSGISKDIALEVGEIRFIDDTKARITGKCDSYDDVSRVEKSLVDYGAFTEVRLVSAEPHIKKKISFKIDVVFN
ncbi:MAG: pilus assembly protein PilM [Candidatus Dadabacteria bacterium]|nr:pilus assembly protein PilM [Candidatus Dadabacteria bacterium]